MEKRFEKQTFAMRLKSMVKVDVKRMFTMPLVYILIAVSFVMPILILVMTSMMDGSVTTDANGNQTVMEGFDNVWQIIGTVGGSAASCEEGAAMSMDLVSMCNINMLYFIISVLVCVFVADDFRSGYAKNLFTVRAKKSEYVISKTAVCFIGGALMIFAFFIGAVLGGKFAGLPYTMVGFNVVNLLFCVLSKGCLVLLFVSIFLMMSVIAKQKLWLSILLSMGVGMFLFMVVPIVSPLDAGILHVILSLFGSGLFAFGFGCISNLILKKTALV